MLTIDNTDESAHRAAEVLRSGGVVLYPTDTLYGLGADALSDEAVAKIFSIKGRDEGKPVHAIVNDLSMVKAFAHVDTTLSTLVGELPQGQVTYVVKKSTSCTTGICKSVDTFGFRIPDNEFCLLMLQEFGGPITATSANKAGALPQHSVDSILSQLGDVSIDLVIDAGTLPDRAPSSVVDVSHTEPVILREGAVAVADIWYALKPER